jgi:hypothetical protein
MRVLGIKSAKYGCVKFDPDLLSDSAECDGIVADISPFLGLEITSDFYLDSSVLLYVSGYASSKSEKVVGCELCRSVIIGSSYDDPYVDDLNRGGLTLPSDDVVDIGFLSLAIMNRLISREYEEKFLICQY